MTSWWARWRLKSPSSRLFTQPFFHDAVYRKPQSSASLAFVRGIHRWPVNSPHKGPVMWKVFPFDDVIMIMFCYGLTQGEIVFLITSLARAQSYLPHCHISDATMRTMEKYIMNSQNMIVLPNTTITHNTVHIFCWINCILKHWEYKMGDTLPANRCYSKTRHIFDKWPYGKDWCPYLAANVDICHNKWWPAAARQTHGCHRCLCYSHMSAVACCHPGVETLYALLAFS